MSSHRAAVSFALLTLSWGCASGGPGVAPQPRALPAACTDSSRASSTAPAPSVASALAPIAAPPTVAPAPEPASPNAKSAEPPAASPQAPEQSALAARATGPATGGPRGNHPCEFHESVDTYQRQCSSKVNPDGSLTVTAKGTSLNPDRGFEFTLHGGQDNVWTANGTLNAFGQCSGPFVARVSSALDHGVTVYDLRFKEHCMIVVR